MNPGFSVGHVRAPDPDPASLASDRNAGHERAPGKDPAPWLRSCSRCRESLRPNHPRTQLVDKSAQLQACFAEEPGHVSPGSFVASAPCGLVVAPGPSPSPGNDAIGKRAAPVKSHSTHDRSPRESQRLQTGYTKPRHSSYTNYRTQGPSPPTRSCVGRVGLWPRSRSTEYVRLAHGVCDQLPRPGARDHMVPRKRREGELVCKLGRLLR